MAAAFTACDRLPSRITIAHGRADDTISRTFISRIGDKDIQFALTDQDISRFPAWSPAIPPPLTIPDVAKVAEAALPKYTHGTQGWYMRGVSIEQIRRSAEGKDKWIYLVNFGGVNEEDYIQIPVDFSGTPIKGIERPHEEFHD
ncbi:MAG: hypothetical protein JST05_09115 [Acidobacteria bacterium]|nr:hypothetical protein [Acidobacteriota bacterium]